MSADDRTVGVLLRLAPAMAEIAKLSEFDQTVLLLLLDVRLLGKEKSLRLLEQFDRITLDSARTALEVMAKAKAP